MVSRLGSRWIAAVVVGRRLSTDIVDDALVVVLWVGCMQVIDGALDFGTLTSFLLLSIYTVSSLGG